MRKFENWRPGASDLGIIIALIVGVATILILVFVSGGNKHTTTANATMVLPVAKPVIPATKISTALTATEHVIRRGQFLQWIAAKYGVGSEAMLLANEDYLREKYKGVCGHLSNEFRNRGSRSAQRGGRYYCNDRYNRPYGNTLRPGWKLKIPATAAPEKIQEVVANIAGTKIALVIDDTGSMNDDRQKVSEFYLAAFRQYGKRIVGVWLYSDGRVRKYEAGGVKFFTAGGTENTFGALSEAARENPDTIVLVTDEPGDDWNWNAVSNLPPIVGHCLKDNGTYHCADNLKHVAKATGGQYVAGIKN